MHMTKITTAGLGESAGAIPCRGMSRVKWLNWSYLICSSAVLVRRWRRKWRFVSCGMLKGRRAEFCYLYQLAREVDGRIRTLDQSSPQPRSHFLISLLIPPTAGLPCQSNRARE
ncbi:hypothetical protein IQ06DRAFT_68202 [Phaeosphaeriaceae sp. SRC1lsM3a]|nr:hypothetical protein IQ06DRAFT_68202 [Stagonospora sp. SRC1lsM3a]